MDQSQLGWIAGFIWRIADDVLRDVYVRGKYRDVILPMTVIRRLDSVLEPTKAAVLTAREMVESAGIANPEGVLRSAAGQAFYNASPFMLKDLTARTRQQRLEADFTTYLDGFSPNVQDILDKFGFRAQIPKLVQADALGSLIGKFLDDSINLSPKPELRADGSVRLPGLDNHGMGTIFEELIRRFNEENNEEAGEHFTPRDVVTLMADLICLPIADQLESSTYLVYDGACGTGGMLTLAEERIKSLAADRGKSVAIHLYGQEVNSETYAICKADLLLKGEGEQAEHFELASTLSRDVFSRLSFDFLLSNPPYGKSWKSDQERVGKRGEVTDPRFVVAHRDEPELPLVTRSSDGQLMFLVNLLSKMKHGTPLGSRIAEVHNGSSLFTGDAGSGESNIRRWIIENDWLEAIVALPKNIFYNTGIATYVWVLTNRKPAPRQGMVQLIDATSWYRPLRRNLGKKNCELSAEDIEQICRTFLDMEENEQSRVFPNEAFGYWKVTVERPLRLRVTLDEAALTRLREACAAAKEEPLASLVERVAEEIGVGPHRNYSRFSVAVETAAQRDRMKLTAKRQRLLRDVLAEPDEAAAPVIRTAYDPTRRAADPLHGRYDLELGGDHFLVEFEPDPELRDMEQVPLLEEGGIEAFIRREVLPHAPDAWVDASATKVGYEISFTRYFYTPKPLRTLDEIKADIYALEAEAEGLLEQVVGAR